MEATEFHCRKRKHGDGELNPNRSKITLTFNGLSKPLSTSNVKNVYHCHHPFRNLASRDHEKMYTLGPFVHSSLFGQTQNERSVSIMSVSAMITVFARSVSLSLSHHCDPPPSGMLLPSRALD